MKEKYEKPEMTITEFENDDIVTDSLISGAVATPDPGWIPGWY